MLVLYTFNTKELCFRELSHCNKYVCMYSHTYMSMTNMLHANTFYTILRNLIYDLEIQNVPKQNVAHEWSSLTMVTLLAMYTSKQAWQH